MEEIKKDIYNWLLVKKDGTWNNLWSKSIDKPQCGEPDKLEWIEWNKPLPNMIDPATGADISYTKDKLEIWYSDNYDENGELIRSNP